MSYIVTMIRKVFYDLRIFMFFYFILILMFSAILSILKVGNYELSNDPDTRHIRDNPLGYPNQEYKHLPYLFANIFTVTRISLGDFDFDASTKLDDFENIVFWFVWFAIVMMTCIIFLNFIIAEVSSSYEEVKTHIKGLILKERASLIKESEDMMLKGTNLNKEHFPKYLITRDQEN